MAHQNASIAFDSEEALKPKVFGTISKHLLCRRGKRQLPDLRNLNELSEATEEVHSSEITMTISYDTPARFLCQACLSCSRKALVLLILGLLF
ncbi:hypothetical protein [Ruegeria sp. 6PALISEP08]|uniref:hypothetical protein n=1 Tax=Ruegeria sp. 6PALISEP08 TaxID=1225660 RepID=UPI0012EDBC7B|nr:hypothetical protein [Ruegeria sp. 6PALISEP08]